MRKKIDRLTIKGFKSIKDLSNFPLGDINIVIGANGATAFERLDEKDTVGIEKMRTLSEE